MTILEITNKLYEFFLENDTFELENDFTKIISSSERSDIDKSLLIQGLNELEEVKIIKKLPLITENDEKNVKQEYFWVLNKPMSHYEQTVTLSPVICAEISTILNVFQQISEQNDLECDMKNITAKDIHNMVILLAAVLEKEKNDINEEDKEGE